MIQRSLTTPKTKWKPVKKGVPDFFEMWIDKDANLLALLAKAGGCWKLELVLSASDNPDTPLLVTYQLGEFRSAQKAKEFATQTLVEYFEQILYNIRGFARL